MGTILGIYEQYCNIDFVESGAADADMLFGRNTNSPVGYAYFPELLPAVGADGNDGGDVWISSATSANLEVGAGQPGWNTIMHEIGHAIGLKHPFEPDGSQPVLPNSTDNHQYTVMSYTTRAKSLLRVVSEDGMTFEEYVFLGAETPMLYDVAAIQHLYGKNMETGAGNTVYTFDPDTPFFRCLWDASGTDTISVSNFSRGCTINLNAGKFSSIKIPTDALPEGYVENPDTAANIYDGTNNLSIAFGCTIENATGGSGADRLTGNAKNNTLVGNGGNDIIDGGKGNDKLNGGTGKDKLSGGEGTDTLTCDSTDTSINGGVGTADVLKLSKGSLDVNPTKIFDIEVIDLRAGGNNVLKLDKNDVLAISSTDQLKIMGDATDTVDFATALGTPTLSGTFNRYNLGSGAVLFIETDVVVI